MPWASFAIVLAVAGAMIEQIRLVRQEDMRHVLLFTPQIG